MEVPQKYVERIRQVYPNLPIERMEFNREGLVNEVVILNDTLVCRFVKAEWGRDLLATEVKILELLRPHVHVHIPRFEHLEADFCTYRFLPGEPLTRSALLEMSETGCRRIMAQLGEFLAQMHGVSQGEIEAAQVPGSDAARGQKEWLELYERVKEHLYPHFWRYQHAYVDKLFAPIVDGSLDLSYDPVLTHGDLGVYHLLYNPVSSQLSR